MTREVVMADDKGVVRWQVTNARQMTKEMFKRY